MPGQNDDARPDEQSEKQSADTQQADSIQQPVDNDMDKPLDEIEQLLNQLAEARAKAEEHWDQLLRARAETDNIRKRAEREVLQARKYGLEGIARELLPIYDSLNLGLAELDRDDARLDTAREGMRLITQMMAKLMQQFSIQEIDPAGEPFDPETHQAMTMQETAEQAPNTVLQVLQKGYRLNDRVLRPAMVIVARAPETSSGPNDSDPS